MTQSVLLGISVHLRDEETTHEAGDPVHSHSSKIRPPLNVTFLIFPEMVETLPVHSCVHEKRPEEVGDSASSDPDF